MDLSGRMNGGKWSPLSWKRVFSSALFQGAFLQERVYLSDHSFHALLNITEITSIEQGHRSQSGNCQFFLFKESVLVTQHYGQIGSPTAGRHVHWRIQWFSALITWWYCTQYLRVPDVWPAAGQGRHQELRGGPMNAGEELEGCWKGWFGRDLKDNLVPTPHRGQGCCPLDQVLKDTERALKCTEDLKFWD